MAQSLTRNRPVVGVRRTPRNNLPGRLEIPSPAGSASASSSAPSSLSPLIFPINQNGGTNASAQQRLTNDYINAMGRTTPDPSHSGGEYNGTGDHTSITVVPPPDGAEPADIDPDDITEQDRLGEGAGGTVRKVLQKSTGRIMAKKTIPANPNPEVHRQILRELQFLRTCHSPNIVSYYGAYLEDADTTIAICMEFCEGGSLDGIYKRVCEREGRIGEAVLGKIGEAVLGGLVYLHHQKIIHRDIKPSNILVTKRGEIKICDFGVSGQLVNSLAGTFTGTSYYMAPERIQGQPYRVSADVWSLGLTIMEVAQNRFPFPPEGEQPLMPIELLSYIVNMPVPELGGDYTWSDDLKDFLKVCLEKVASQRPTPRQMLDHPFIQWSMTKNVNLERWIKEVWEWQDD